MVMKNEIKKNRTAIGQPRATARRTDRGRWGHSLAESPSQARPEKRTQAKTTIKAF